MFKTEDEFDKEILKHWGKTVVFKDGIINIEKYKKILWILKEPNRSNSDKEENFRDFYSDVTGYGKWKSTFKRIILVSDMITKKLKEIPDIDSIIKAENPLEKVAIININKNGGSSTTNISKLKKQYNANKNILLDQVLGIAPDLIINCTLVDDFYNDIIKQYKLTEKSFGKRPEIGYAYNPKKLIINYYHPNCRRRGMTDKWYCETILKIYQKWQKIINKS
ncbi:MAG: hypothetical protein IKX50_05765 [Spirochaetia bacterium]|nr:hypothetical protein [Spirochaetia bacterium]MBR5017218.1 hypothetical protein [Spirochaetia bacterium]